MNRKGIKMHNWLIRTKCDLSKPQCIGTVTDAGFICAGDNLAHTWTVECLYKNEKADLAGYSAKAYFVRGDKLTTSIDGEIEDNVASVLLDKTCYQAPGFLSGVIKLENADTGASITIGAMRVHVSTDTTDSYIDPEMVIPSLSELLAEVETLRKVTMEATEAETARTEAEEDRVEAENGRQTAEASRVSAEASRVSAEASRVSAEAARVSAEAARVSAEKERGVALGGLSFSINSEDGGIDISYNG